MLKVIVVQNLRAVSMHHHVVAKKLILGARYHLVWEPECTFDPGNAVAVLDERNVVSAYLTREDAVIISRLFCANIIINNKVYCKTKVEPHVEKQDLGPQQECNIQFKIKDENLDIVTYIIAKLVYNVY